MSTDITASHIPAETRRELIEAMQEQIRRDEAHVNETIGVLMRRGNTPVAIVGAIERAIALGRGLAMFDCVESGSIIADGDEFDTVFYGVDAVLAYGVNPPTQVGETRLQADLAFLENLARYSTTYAATGELPENMTGEPGLIEANTIRNSWRCF